MYAASGAAILHVCTILGLGWQVFLQEACPGNCYEGNCGRERK